MPYRWEQIKTFLNIGDEILPKNYIIEKKWWFFTNLLIYEYTNIKRDNCSEMHLSD